MSRNALMVCNCNRTMAIDAGALAQALGRDAIPVYTQLCRREAAQFVEALDADFCTVACTQEAPLFTQLAEEAGKSTELKFVNIRELAGWSAEGAAAQPKIAALLAMAELPPPQPAPSGRLASKGQLLIIGPAEAAIAWADELANSFDVSVLITSARGAELPATRRYPVWSGQPRSVEGYLGAFDVRWEQNNPIDLDLCTRCNACIRVCPEDAIDYTYQVDLERCKSHRACVKACAGIGAIDFDRPAAARSERFDLVLDLSPAPLLRALVKPHGYAAPGQDPLDQSTAVRRLAGLVGEFDKPRYADYSEKLCAHSRNAKTGCTRCIDACATEAVRSLGDKVWVHPYLCAGCGDCATTCPTGAITYQYPSAVDVGERLRRLLTVYRTAGGRDAVLLFHNAGGRSTIDTLARRGRGLPARVIPLELHSVGAVGLDLVLGAIAWGASQVFCLVDEEGAAEHQGLIDEQAKLADTVLNALGYGGVHWKLLRADEPAALEAALWNSPPATGVAQPASFHLSGRKRESLDLALAHLLAQAPTPVEVVALPAGAPFGTLAIDKERCTLCKACVGACPPTALRDAADAPVLNFVERNCVQCGLCVKTCPEDAIRLIPRLLIGAAARSAVTLNEAEPFNCVRCGKPFGTRRIVETMTGRLGAHPMFSGKALRRIQMCADCRVIDMMESGDEMSIFDLKR